MTVVAVVTCEEEAAAVATAGLRLARSMDGDLTVIAVTATRTLDAASLHEIKLAEDDEELAGLVAAAAVLRLRCSVPTAHETPAADEPDGKPADDRDDVALMSIPAAESLAAVRRQVAGLGARYLVVGSRRTKGGRRERLAHQLYESCPVNVVMVRVAPDAADRPWRRILVPTAGGPNAYQALRVASRLASVDDATVVPMRVQSAAGELARAVGRRLLHHDLERAGLGGLDAQDHWQPRVEMGGDPEAVIARVAREEAFDLVLLGGSRAGALRGQLFGAIPERQLAGVPSPAVAVVRRRWPTLDRFKVRVARWLDATIPQLTRDDRVALYASIEAGTLWRFDFAALMGLATAIATLGLLQSSTAVVIGAMLVAPLMTPILGAGLALVQGNLPLLRRAVVAVTLGYLLALAIGFLGAKTFPIPSLTPELLARGGPTLLDLGVGLFSGVAAAYCLGRPGLVAALPGVAIAAALVPPIATMGVSLALGETGNALGAGLLFGTNVIAIVIGAAVALWAVGVRRPPGPTTVRRWAHLAFAVLLLAAAAVAVPLSEGLRDLRRPAIPNQEALAARLADVPQASLVRVEAARSDQQTTVDVYLEAEDPLDRALIDELVAIVGEAQDDDPVVRVHTELVVVSPGARR